MFLRIIGICWMVAPFLVLLIPNGDSGELFPYGLFSFICGFLLYKAAPKNKKQSVETFKPNIESKIENISEGFNENIRRFENEDHERFMPKMSDYEEEDDSIKEVDEFVKENFPTELSNDDVLDLLRFGNGSPGKNARFITVQYFKNFYVGKDTVESIENLLDERIVIYKMIGLSLNDDLYANALTYYNNLPSLIFFLTLFESLDNNQLFMAYIHSKNAVYKIILEEYNKCAPEAKQISMDLQDIHDETLMILLPLLSTFESSKE